MSDYEDYARWKNWGKALREDIPQAVADGFAGEMARAGVAPGGRLLEIGFGDGLFLKWATMQGYQIVGVEIIEELVTLATEHGFEAVCANLCDPKVFELLFTNVRFDAIVAFDVFEHIEVEPLKGLFQRLAGLLLPCGCIVARVPNGGSPMGEALYNGDHTHRTNFTESKLRQLILGSGLTIHLFTNSKRVYGQPRYKFFKKLVYVIRDCIEVVIGYLYFSRRIPLDPAVTFILKKYERK